MPNEVDNFIQKVMLLEAPGTNVFGGGIPGIAGDVSTTTAANNSPADVIRRLQGDALTFMQAWQAPQPASTQLNQLAARIEGYLNMLKTLSAVPNADRLINDLHHLMSKQGEPDGIVIDH